MIPGLFKNIIHPSHLYFIGILFLGVTSGTSLNLVIFTIPYQLSEMGHSTYVIGAMFLTALPYCLKPIWAPFIDKYSIPFLCTRFGQRRGWALAVQGCLSASIALLLFIDPALNLHATAIISFVIACFAAIMDLVLDSYRIERSSDAELLSKATACGVVGMRLGMLISSAGALFISYSLGWYYVYLVELAATLIGPIVILCIKEPEVKERQLTNHLLSLTEYFKTLKESLELLQKHYPKLLIIMIMVLLYKVCDSVPMAMSSPFFLDLSFNSYEIAYIVKTYGFFVLLIGCTAGGFLSSKIGITRSLLVCGILQILAPVMFLILSILGHNLSFFIVTAVVQNFVSGLGVTALSIYLSSLCNRGLVATQFSMISAFNSLARIMLSSCAGVLAAHMPWAEFFALTALLGSIFIVFFYFIYRK